MWSNEIEDAVFLCNLLCCPLGYWSLGLAILEMRRIRFVDFLAVSILLRLL